MTTINTFTARAIMLVLVFILFSAFADAQVSTPKTVAAAGGPKITLIDADGLKALLKTNDRPLLINFWATWCDPCREEFPDLGKIDSEFRGKIDFITVSLDDLDDIATSVPKFLRDVGSEIPAYLLNTPDEDAAISLVSKTWAGNLPMTVLFDKTGNMFYVRNGKVRYESLRDKLNALLIPAAQPEIKVKAQ